MQTVRVGRFGGKRERECEGKKSHRPAKNTRLGGCTNGTAAGFMYYPLCFIYYVYIAEKTG